MSLNEANLFHAKITDCIEKRQLKEAFDTLKRLVAGRQDWALSEKISELEFNYRYMIHYLIEGNEDPEQKKIYSHLIRSIYTLADDLREQALIRESSTVFFEKIRMANIRQPFTLSEFQENLSRRVDTFSVIDLLPDGEEKSNRFKQNSIEKERIIQEMFYAVFAAPRAGEEQIEAYEAFLKDRQMPSEAKSMFISALTLNILQRFDRRKTTLLLESSTHPDTETALRAAVGVVAVFRQYKNRWEHYPELTGRLEIMADNPLFTRRLMMVVIQFIQAHQTEKITRKLNEEIIPEMMKISPLIGKKINFDEWMGEAGMDEKNPEWQKIFDETGLTDKLQEFADMQLGGADVFHSTFSNLKNYPFFNEMSNWLLPFDKQHSSLQQMFSDKSKGDNLLAAMLDTPMICNSDKYSFCFSAMAMPEQYRKRMFSQLNAESEELRNMTEEEVLLNPNQGEESFCRQYIRDLYRFFKLYPRRADFIDIFSSPLNYHRIQAFRSVVSDPKNLEHIALYYFEKNNFEEALDTYLLLAEKGNSTSETWQKIAYCRQMSNDIRGALDAYRKAELSDGNNPWILRRTAHCLRLLKEPESALQYYRRLEQLKPDDLNIQLHIGHCFLELGQYAEALNYYFKVELLNSDNSRAQRSIAWCAFLSRKFDVARQYYAQVIQNKPNAHDYLNAGHVELCLSDTKKAVGMYGKALKSAGGFQAFYSMFEEDREELLRAGIDAEILPLILDKIWYDE